MSRSIFAVVFSAVGLCFAGRALSDDKPAAPQGMPSPAEMKAMMDKWTKVARPNEHHKHLEVFVGSWNTTMKMWMAGPTAPPSEFKGTAEVKWIMDGRYIMEEYKGQSIFPDENGVPKPVPHNGIAITGYDAFRNMYVGSWCDNLGTAMLSLRGVREPSGKSFTFYAEMDEPMLDVVGRMIKAVHRIEGKDKHVMEVYDLAVGDHYKVFEIEYVRK